MSENRKIPYRFVPIPRFFLESEHLKDAHFLQFVCFAFSRTLIEPGAMIFCNKPIFLEPFEFIYGRLKWSQLLQQEEHVVRKYICQLVDQQIVRKVASKSTSKFTVFTWAQEHFLDFSSQQKNRKSASKLAANPPQYENKNIEIETTTGAPFDDIAMHHKPSPPVVVFSEMGNINSAVKKKLAQLSPEEQKNILELFKSNTKK